jgi:hypothetical protein
MVNNNSEISDESDESDVIKSIKYIDDSCDEIEVIF